MIFRNDSADNCLCARQRFLWYLSCAVLLLIFCLQTCAALRVESATVDETIHFTRGYLYLALGDLHFKIGHPILANALNALPVWALPISTSHSIIPRGRQVGRCGVIISSGVRATTYV